MRACLYQITQCIDYCTKIFFRLSQTLTLLLVLLTAQQVIARYFFSASSVALQELEWHLFGFIFLFAMAQTLKTDEHVRIDIIQAKLSSRSQVVIDILGICFFLLPMALTVILFGYAFMVDAFHFANPHSVDYWSRYYFPKNSMAYDLSAAVEAVFRHSFLLGEISSDPGGLEARWIIKAAIPFGFALLTLQAISELIKKVLLLLEKENDAEC